MKLIMKRGGGGGFISDLGSAFDDAVHSVGSAVDDAVGQVPGGWGTVISAGTGGFGGDLLGGGDFLGSGFDAGFDPGSFDGGSLDWGGGDAFSDSFSDVSDWGDTSNFDSWEPPAEPAYEPPQQSSFEPQVDSYQAPPDATPQDWGMPEDTSWSDTWQNPEVDPWEVDGAQSSAGEGIPEQDPFEVDGQQTSSGDGFNENADIKTPDMAGGGDLMKGLKGLANDKMFGGLAKMGLGLLGAKAARSALGNRGYSPKSGSSLLGGGPLGAPGRNLASGGGGTRGSALGGGAGGGAGGTAGSVLGIGGRPIAGGAASLANVGRNLPIALGKIGAAHGMAQVPYGPLMMSRHTRNGGV